MTRLNPSTKTRVVSPLSILADKLLPPPKTIEFTRARTANRCPIQLRRFSNRNSVTGKHYVLPVTDINLPAKTSTGTYKIRSQVELRFKWVKQNLRGKSFIGITKTAVMTLTSIGLCVYLPISSIELQAKLKKSVRIILHLLQLNLFDIRNLIALFLGGPHLTQLTAIKQMALL